MGLYVHEFGPADGSPVVALHGLSGHGGRFADLAERLAALAATPTPATPAPTSTDPAPAPASPAPTSAGIAPARAAAAPADTTAGRRYRLLAPDLRGHGRSSTLPPWDLDALVDDVVGVLDRYGLARVPLIGHSLGGVVALRLAAAAPERVAGLALLDPSTGMSPEKALRNADAMLVDHGYASPADARADRAHAGWSGFPGAYLDAEVSGHLDRRGDRWRWRYHRPAMVALMSALTRPVPLPPAGMPTLLVVGERSDVVRDEWRDACRDALGDRLTLTGLPCGHLVYYEEPAATAAAVTGFLSGL